MCELDIELHPKSGYANSYFDVGMTIRLSMPFSGILRVQNATTGQQLKILTTSNGVIRKDTEVHLLNANSVDIYLNLFNDDKMNTLLQLYENIKLQVEIASNDIKNTKDVYFYNESETADKDVIPFEIHADNMMLTNNHLCLHVLSTESRKYELCLANSINSPKKFTFEVCTKKGVTTIYIPSELYQWVLSDKSWKKRKYQLFYVKFEGITYSRFANRVFIPIPNMVFGVAKDLTLQLSPTSRIGPANLQLSDEEFVLSDRFYVMCPKKHSALGEKSNYSKNKFLNMTMFMHESQHIAMLTNRMQAMSVSDDTVAYNEIQKTQRILQSSRLKEKDGIIKPKINANKFAFLNTYAQFSNVSNVKVDKPTKEPGIAPAVSSFQVDKSPKKPCLPCSRRKQQLNGQ